MTDRESADDALTERLVNLYLHKEKVWCEDCKHCHLRRYEEAICKSPSITDAIADSRFKPEYPWETTTAARLEQYCGPEARWFTPKVGRVPR